MKSAPDRNVVEAWPPYRQRTASFADIDARVHVWRLDTGRLDESHAGPLLDEDVARAERQYTAAVDRRRFVLAMSALRAVLADVVDAGEDAASPRLRFSDGPAGSLRLETHPCLHVALSVSDGLAVMAATRSGEIGLDLRRVSPMAEMGSVVKERFDDAERGAILGCPVDMRDVVFHRILARKNALVRVAGSGRHGSAELRPKAASNAMTWTVVALPDLDDHVAALARCRSAHGLRLWSWPGIATQPVVERRSRGRSIRVAPSPTDGPSLIAS